MVVEKQKSFDWKVVLYLFLGGTGGGLFFMGFALERLNLMASVARGTETLGPILVIVGCFFLLLHSGSGFRTKIYLLFLKPRRSWISKGTWIISIYVVSAFLYTILGIRELGWVAVIFSLLMAIYPGFLLSENKSIPLWRTSASPILFLFSGVSSALAFLMVIIPFYSVANEELMAVLHGLSWSIIIMIIVQLVILSNYLIMNASQEPTISESLRLLKRPLFIFGALLLGLLLPLLLHIFVIASGKAMEPAVGVISGILLINGAISLRLSIVRAGVYLPRHSL